MLMSWSLTMCMVNMVWVTLSGWVLSCLNIADEIAGSLRSGDIDLFHFD